MSSKILQVQESAKLAIESQFIPRSGYSDLCQSCRVLSRFSELCWSAAHSIWHDIHSRPPVWYICQLSHSHFRPSWSRRNGRNWHPNADLSSCESDVEGLVHYSRRRREPGSTPPHVTAKSRRLSLLILLRRWGCLICHEIFISLIKPWSDWTFCHLWLVMGFFLLMLDVCNSWSGCPGLVRILGLIPSHLNALGIFMKPFSTFSVS